jgi:hypothetical protein
MRTIRLGLLFVLSLVWCFPVFAQTRLIIIDQSALPYDLGPTKFENSPTRYENSSTNYDNSSTNYDNSPTKYENSASNYENSNGKNRLITQAGQQVGYTVYSPTGVLNIFTKSGRRFGYVPKGNQTVSIFQSDGSNWCGSLGISQGVFVMGLTRNCFYRLLSDQ